MSFETPEQRRNKAQETGTKLHEIITKVDGSILEKAIRWMGPAEREKLYQAVEVSKTAKDSLV